MVRKAALIISIICVNIIPAQSIPLRFERFGVKQGLAYESVHFVLHDSKGFIWLTTEGGLSRFDGYKFTNYFHNPTDTSTISSDYVHLISEDSKGNFWLSTKRGLDRLNYSVEGVERLKIHSGNTRSFSGAIGPTWEYNDSLLIVSDHKNLYLLNTLSYEVTQLFCEDSVNVGSFHEINKEEIWVSGNSSTAWLIKSKKQQIEKFELSLLSGYKEDKTPIVIIRKFDDNVMALHHDKIQYIFDRTDNQFSRLEFNYGGKTIELNILDILPFRKKNEYLLATRDGKIFHCISNNIYSGKIQILEELELPVKNLIFRKCYKDDKNNFWFASNQGLFLLDERRDQIFNYTSDRNDPNTLSGDLLFIIIKSGQGIFWINSTFDGINKVQYPKMDIIVYENDPGNKNSLAQNEIYKIIEDEKGGLWIALQEKGICYFDREKSEWSSYIPETLRNEKGKLEMSAMYKDGNTIWVGSRERGAWKFDITTKKWEQFSFEINGKSSDREYIRYFQRLDDGRFLIGSRSEGLVEFSEGGTEYYDIPYLSGVQYSGSGAISVLDIIIRGDSYWICSDNGLFKYNRKTKTCDKWFFAGSDNPDSLSSGSIFTGLKDKYGRLWFGTYGGGINILVNEEKFLHIGRDKGLPSMLVVDLLEDDKKNIWAATTKGLCRINPDDFSITVFGEKDGLLSDEINTESLTQLSTGEIACGGPSGLNIFYPESYSKNLNRSPLVITDIFVNGDTNIVPNGYCYFNDRVFDYNTRILSFRFSYLQYYNSHLNTYEYFLEGFSRDTVDLGTEHKIDFTNLDPGNYTLYIRAFNDDGIPSKNDIHFRFKITPPWWQTWWFMTLVVIFFVLSLYLFFEYRRFKDRQRQKALDDFRSKISSDLHDEIGSNLGGIALLSERLRKEKSLDNDIKMDLASIAATTRLTSDTIREIIWFINPKHNTTERIINRMKDIANSLLYEMDYELKLDAMGQEISLKPDFNRAIYLVYKEALNNISKHSGADKVSVITELKDGIFSISIMDNGKGFNPEENKSGQGIENIKKRAYELGGKLKIESAPGRGTKIIFKVNIL